MMKPVEYFFKSTVVEQKVLIVHNKTNQEKLFQVLINSELFKIIFLSPNEKKEILINDEDISMIDVVEID